MGHDRDVALYALKSNEYSLERAIKFIYDTDEYGKLEHPYISLGNMCAICQMDNQYH